MTKWLGMLLRNPVARVTGFVIAPVSRRFVTAAAYRAGAMLALLSLPWGAGAMAVEQDRKSVV